MKLTKKLILDYLEGKKLMTIATWGEHPWIASVYFTHDANLNFYFLSSPKTLHGKQIEANPDVALSVVDSNQDINKPKKGLQMYGNAHKISDTAKIQHTLKLWKTSLGVRDPLISYENMLKKIIHGRMYIVVPKKIKLFDQTLFPVEDGDEPVLEL